MLKFRDAVTPRTGDFLSSPSFFMIWLRKTIRYERSQLYFFRYVSPSDHSEIVQELYLRDEEVIMCHNLRAPFTSRLVRDPPNSRPSLDHGVLYRGRRIRQKLDFSLQMYNDEVPVSSHVIWTVQFEPHSCDLFYTYWSVTVWWLFSHTVSCWILNDSSVILNTKWEPPFLHRVH